MKRVVFLMLLGSLAIIDLPAVSAPLGAYHQVMQAVYARDEAALKYLVSVGVNVNATNMQGKTPLCTAVENQDYEGYELLLSQGATTRTPCMREMNPEVLERFQAEQPPLGTYYKGAVLTASRNGALTRGGQKVASAIAGIPYPHLGEILLGGVAVGTAFAIGVHGSSGGESDGSVNNYVYTAPLNLDPSSFENTEYSGGSWDTSINHISFLEKINASDAYARGYTGYKVSRDTSGNLVSLTDEESATAAQKYITDTKVKVAVMDNGQYYNTDLYNAAQTESSVKGLNYTYGVKSENNTSSYWDWNNTSGKAVLYENGEMTASIAMTQDEWTRYQGQFAPVCANTGDTNCLMAGTADSSGNVPVYYVANYNSDDTQPAETNVKATYSSYSYLWDLYKSKYGETGYVYDATDAFGKFFKISEDEAISHGTHVAGIVAALRNGTGMQGVAYNAEVIPVKADLKMGQSLNHIADVIAAYPNLKIINLSVGPSGEEEQNYTNNNAEKNQSYWDSWGGENYLATAYEAAKTNNVALVFSAGNGDSNLEGLSQSSIFSAAPLVDSAYKNLLINVVALGNDNKIASYSNRCGATAGYCLAAPGGDGDDWIISTALGKNLESGYTGMQGTSQAAPVVSGSLAVLMGAFPFLTTQQAVQILFDTADYITPTEDEITAYNTLAADTNAYTTNTQEGKYNAIYGHGLVDLEAATSPIGLPKIAFETTTSGASAVAALSSVTVSPMVAKAVRSLPENLIVLDDYSRAYQRPTKGFVRTEKRGDGLRRSFRSFMAHDEKEVVSSDSLSFAFSKAPTDKKSVQTGSMSMLMRPNKNIQMRLGFTEDTVSFGGSYVGRSLQNPFMNMRQAFGADARIAFAKNWALTGSWYSGKNGFVDEDVFDKMAKQSRMQLIESGVAYQGIQDVSFGVFGGLMNEEDSLFGTRGAGAFKTDGAQTRFVRVMANYQPSQKFRLSGSYTYGMTEANKGTALMQFSRLTSDAFALAAEYTPDEKQTFGFKLVSPLRVRSGKAAFNLPVARDLYEDRIYRETYTTALKPEAREYDLSVFYANEISSDLSWAGETGLRLNPDHQAQEPDYRALFKLNWTW
ncbi:MAG: S8 family serine peptidase [Alphaproteobacteria bacterium]